MDDKPRKPPTKYPDDTETVVDVSQEEAGTDREADTLLQGMPAVPGAESDTELFAGADDPTLINPAVRKADTPAAALQARPGEIVVKDRFVVVPRCI